jgi:competence protein ComEC
LLVAPERRPAQGHFDVTVFDVGHGLSVLVETRRHRLLFDTGPVFRSGFDVGGEIVVPAIRRLSTQPLDTVIVSHADLDHSGGAAAVMRGHPAARLLAGPDFTDFGATACRRGEQWIWDGVKFAVLHPADDFLPRGNDSSCVLKIEAKDLSALLTGDIERRGEADLVDGVNFAADFVVVPHHGSATSSTAAFVRGTGARHAVVSAGYDNRWGFPRDEVRARWEAAGAEIHVTGDSGALSFGSASPDRVGQLRQDRRRYWRAGIFPGT